jgi:phage tail-like protein
MQIFQKKELNMRRFYFIWNIGIVGILTCLSINIASEFSVNTHRFDPYKQFKFRVKWDGKVVPGIFKISGLHRNTKVVELREAGQAKLVKKMPGHTSYEPIVLERGRTHDLEFEKWANQVWNPGSGAGTGISQPEYQKDIIIDLLNEAGQLVISFKVYRCWPSRYSALQGLMANSPAVAIESLVLEHEGWERDFSVTEPVEPSFTEP